LELSVSTRLAVRSAVAVMKFVASVISVWNRYLALSRLRDGCY